MVHDYYNFRTAVGKTHLNGTLETRHAIRHPNNYPHTSPQSHNRQQARNETVATISQKRATQPVFVMNRAEWFKKVCWNSLVVVTQIGPSDSSNAPKRYGISVRCTGRDDLQHRRRSVSVHAKQSSTQPVLAQENFWDSKNSARNSTTNVSVRFPDGFRFGTTLSTAQMTRRTQAYLNTMLGYTKDTRKSLSVGAEWTRKTILQISSRNIWMDRERSRSQGNLDLGSWKARVTTESF